MYQKATRALPGCCLALALLNGVAVAEDSARVDTTIESLMDDQERIQGTWTISRLEMAGKNILADEGAKYQVVIQNNSFITKHEGKEQASYRLKLDSARSPKTIDFVPTDVNKDGPEMIGIYKLDGDTLTIFVSLDMKERPRSYKDGNVTVLVLQRQRR
jgi:uncharacterized protein (TIGR03067 family)